MSDTTILGVHISEYLLSYWAVVYALSFLFFNGLLNGVVAMCSDDVRWKGLAAEHMWRR